MLFQKYFSCKYFPVCLGICVLLLQSLYADDAEAQANYKSGVEALQAQDYVEAAGHFAKAEFNAKSVDLKFQSAMREAESYRTAGYLGKEYETIEKIIKCYPTRIDYGQMVARELAIGDAYYHGYADPAFWSLRFIPWLTDRSRMEEVYKSAIKHAPFAPGGDTARLRLAVHYLKEGKNEEALKLLREIIRCYPKTEAARYAMLELGNALSEMSLTGDGDGKHFDEAISVFREFRNQYPDLSENEWVTISENAARSAYAKRLHSIAQFYHREGRDEPAEVYLLEVMRRFPDTEAAVESEKLLTQLDKSYFPEQILPEIPPEYPKYELLNFPKETRKLLVAPESSNGKYLLPIYDLNLKKEKK